MHAPIILVTNRPKYAMRQVIDMGRAGLPNEKRYLRIVLGVYDILRVEELKHEEGQSKEMCRITYSLDEPPNKDEDERSVQYVTVLHSLDEICTMIEDAKQDKPDWLT